MSAEASCRDPDALAHRQGEFERSRFRAADHIALRHDLQNLGGTVSPEAAALMCSTSPGFASITDPGICPFTVNSSMAPVVTNVCPASSAANQASGLKRSPV